MTSRASIRKPVTYDASQPSNAYEEVAPSTRFRSLTNLSFASMPTQAFTPTVFGFASKESSQTPQEQLERVRRLTVDDAEMVLHAAQIQATYTNNEEPRRSRFGGRFGRFSFKFRKEHKQEAKTPLEHFKNAASKLFSKLSFIKPSSGATVVQLDIPPVPKPLAVPLQRSYSVTNGFQTPRRLSRQPSVSSFNSIATAPEFMYMANTRDVPRKPVPERPASVMIAPAAELGYLSRDVLGPMPRSSKPSGPRISENQTLRVSGHVRQTYTRTMQQRGNFEIRRANQLPPLKPLPSVPNHAEVEEQQNTPVDVAAPTDVDVPVYHQPVEEDGTVTQTCSSTVIPPELTTKESNVEEADISGTDEFFDAPVHANGDTHLVEKALDAQVELKNMLDMLTDKIKLLEVHVDEQAISKLTKAKVTVESLLAQVSQPIINTSAPSWTQEVMESGTASELIKALECMEKALDNPPSHSTLLENAVEPQDSTIESDSALLFNLLNSNPSAPPVAATPTIDDATASEAKAPIDMKEKFHKLREKFQQQATVVKGYTSTGKFAKKAPPPPPCNISENLSLNMDVQSKPRELDTKENLG